MLLHILDRHHITNIFFEESYLESKVECWEDPMNPDETQDFFFSVNKPVGWKAPPFLRVQTTPTQQPRIFSAHSNFFVHFHLAWPKLKVPNIILPIERHTRWRQALRKVLHWLSHVQSIHDILTKSALAHRFEQKGKLCMVLAFRIVHSKDMSSGFLIYTYLMTDM